jgi:hypothetical protein
MMLDHLIKVFICVFFLEWRSYLLITLLSLVLLPDLRDRSPYKFLIYGLEIFFLLGGGLVLHGNPFHYLLHSLHHEVEIFI